jgi:beta-lactamase superfamily II metal-dependent hydrolase
LEKIHILSNIGGVGLRILFILGILFFHNVAIGMASPSPNGNVENIDVKLKNHEMAITFFGLTDGEATLIQGAKGENILVNTGGEQTQEELQEMLSLFGVENVSALIITSGQNLFANHINELITTYHIPEVIATTEISRTLTRLIDPSAQVEITSWEEGSRKVLFPDLTAEVLYAGLGENEGLDLTLQFFEHRLFLMTSYSSKAEEVFLKSDIQDIHIFKVPNWAKVDSLSEKLIHYLNPEISILFESEKNQPDPEILNDLADTWSEIYFTKKTGTVTMKFTEKNYEVITIANEKDA